MDNTLPKVTIAIPFYNNEHTILDAVKSIFAQNYTNWELLLLDDGSTDDSLRLVSKIKDERIRIISDGQNRGRVYRLNEVPNLAKGKYIARMDGDDMMMPERISKQVEFLDLNTEVDLVDTAIYTIDENSNPIGIRNLKKIEDVRQKMLSKAILTHPSVMGRKDWFMDNLYDTRFSRSEDSELWLRTYFKSKFDRITEPLLIYREGRVNVKNYVVSMKEVRDILSQYGKSYASSYFIKKQYIKTYLKAFAYQLTGFFNAQHILSSKRNIELSNEEKHKVKELIQQIKTIKLPGFE